MSSSPLRLHLLRHAKSSWKAPRLPDHDRPLSSRGRRAAVAMGDYMEREGLDFDRVLCSSARRTRETIERALPGIEPPAEILEDLYLATPDEMLELVRQAEPGITDILLVGHNPGVHDLAVGLAGEGPSSRLARLHEKFPTGALATVVFDAGSWDRVLPGKGRLERFMRPKDLPEADQLRL